VVTVRALPKPAPKNFSGYSGTLNLSHQLDKTSVEEGSAVSLITSASGTGNPKSLTLDLVAKSNQYTLFDDKKNINSSVSGGIKSFSLTTRKAIIPKRSGKLVIDVAPLVYFNSRTQLYETIPGRKLELEVLPSSGEPSKEPDALRADDQPAKKEIMMLSAHQVSSKRTPILLPLWLMLLIISVLNLGYLVFSLRDQLARLSELELSDGMNLTKAIKLVKVADSVEKVSVLVKEFAAYAKAEQAEKINKFMAVTDMLLYSGEAESSAKLEEIRASAITILEEIKRHAK
jgi:hypothetical protein